MRPWRVARSLDQLLAQVNAAHPGRDRRSDGAIGDDAHASSVSDHNPDGLGVVHARDFTDDDLAPGMDANALAEQLRLGKDPRIKYVINTRRIFAGTAGLEPWTWRQYRGADPHTSHAHISVLLNGGDSGKAWDLSGKKGQLASQHAAHTNGSRILRVSARGSDVAFVQRFLGVVPADGAFGPVTQRAVIAYQRMRGLVPDGVVGKATWLGMLHNR